MYTCMVMKFTMKKAKVLIAINDSIDFSTLGKNLWRISARRMSFTKTRIRVIIVERFVAESCLAPHTCRRVEDKEKITE